MPTNLPPQYCSFDLFLEIAEDDHYLSNRRSEKWAKNWIVKIFK
jgi:hypothetical protein